MTAIRSLFSGTLSFLSLTDPTLSTANRLHDDNEGERESQREREVPLSLRRRRTDRGEEGEMERRRKSFCGEDFDVFTMKGTVQRPPRSRCGRSRQPIGSQTAGKVTEKGARPDSTSRSLLGWPRIHTRQPRQRLTGGRFIRNS